MTTQWNIVASYDITYFYQRKNIIDGYLDSINRLCTYLKEQNVTETNCENIYALAKLVAHVAGEKKRVIYESIDNHGSQKEVFRLKQQQEPPKFCMIYATNSVF